MFRPDKSSEIQVGVINFLTGQHIHFFCIQFYTHNNRTLMPKHAGFNEIQMMQQTIFPVSE